jgi:hypothetical protein
MSNPCDVFDAASVLAQYFRWVGEYAPSVLPDVRRLMQAAVDADADDASDGATVLAMALVWDEDEPLPRRTRKAVA